MVKKRKIKKMKITSPALEGGGFIPLCFTAKGENASPPLRWSDPPEETVSQVLTFENVTTPGGPKTHWLLYDISARIVGLPPNMPRDVAELPTLFRQGTNDFGTIGYMGPLPTTIPIDAYIFTIYAVDIETNLPPGATKKDVFAAIEGHILAQGRLGVVYGWQCTGYRGAS